MRILAVINDNTGHQIVCLCLGWWLCLCCCIVCVCVGGVLYCQGGGLLHFCRTPVENMTTKTDTKTQLLSPPLFLWLLCESLCFVCVCVSFSVSQCVADASVRKWKCVFCVFKWLKIFRMNYLKAMSCWCCRERALWRCDGANFLFS